MDYEFEKYSTTIKAKTLELYGCYYSLCIRSRRMF